MVDQLPDIRCWEGFIISFLFFFGGAVKKEVYARGHIC